MIRTAAAVSLLALAVGCAGSEETAAPPCPAITVLADAATLTRFRPGGGEDLTDVDVDARITDVLSRCEFVGDPEDGDLAVLVALTPVIAASRGPANDSRQAELDYFVSVVDRNKSVLNKQAFDLDVAFPGNRTQVVARDDDPLVTVQIPLAAPSAAGTYRLYVGFQLSPEQLDHNRRRRGGAR